MKTLVLASVIFFGAFGTVQSAHAAKAPVYTSWQNNIAVGGYDSVSFFSGVPLEGDKAYSYEYMGAIWRFSTRGNLKLFKTNPKAFAPQYGGYCAWALAEGKLAKGSPKYWRVEDGKLYLNFNGRIQGRWESDIPGFITAGDANWPKVLED